jgi:hypothetical protein
MRIGRAIIIPAILTLGVAGSTLAATAMPAAAAQVSHSHVVTLSYVSGPDVFFWL